MARSIGCEGEELNEAEAIRRARQGDGAAFEHLYRSHSRRVYALCLRMVANTAEAEELTQEAFLQVFRKIATFRGESALATPPDRQHRADAFEKENACGHFARERQRSGRREQPAAPRSGRA